ncbi:MAG: branched-chain amino acid ABC transporter permease [Deltaproteobacteria bacterium]|nr:branched-chain amino acid ABC transporter permease [Deltaproteobacteria bacterium]MBW2077366.1 branched-chain amino acid ABC transporter permease [Deltaproteobacteria bacterium]
MIGFLQQAITGLMVGSLYALVGASIVLVYKSTHVVSLAHGQLVAFGALFFWLFFGGLGLPFWISLVPAFVLTALIGLLIERLALRPLIGQPLFAAFLMTFAIFIVLEGVFVLYLKGGSRSLPAFLPAGNLTMYGLSIPINQLISFSAAVLLFIALSLVFKLTKVGLGMRATAEDHRLAQSVGVSVRDIFSYIWILSALVAAVGGIATANVMDVYYMLPYIGINGLIVAICGGLDSLLGAFVAGLLLGVLENVGAGYLDPLVGGGVKDVTAYVVLLLVLLIRPYGLFGLARIERI